MESLEVGWKPSWSGLGARGAVWGLLRALLAPLGALLGRSWGPLNPNGSEVKNVDFLLVFVGFGRATPPDCLAFLLSGFWSGLL